MHDFTRVGRPSSGNLVRRIGLDRNPLCRRSDHVEARARLAALVLCAVTVPFAMVAGVLAQDHLSTRAARDFAGREHHTATVVDDPSLSAARSVVVTTARVAWTDRAGERHEAITLAPAGTRRGDRMTVWSTRNGALTAPPLSGRNVLALAALAASGLLLGVVALSLVLLRALRWLLDRNRFRDWENEWAELDTGRRR
ncbi:hypothetical protein ACFFOS_01680 [Nocardioides kongjuensis]|uniref:Transmembrane protein n=1 Tax=Nocardioides kongjuensis TaxID=349522 RepID=A0A852RGN7_9ACTN|nr:hypothetical protein [Nocardioides kongjuensis]NYD29679.1 hypothetical protein [Nocardioides kongjuensis]